MQTETYDRRHKVRPLPTLHIDLPLWVDISGRIIQSAQTPWSYRVEVPYGRIEQISDKENDA